MSLKGLRFKKNKPETLKRQLSDSAEDSTSKRRRSTDIENVLAAATSSVGPSHAHTSNNEASGRSTKRPLEDTEDVPNTPYSGHSHAPAPPTGVLDHRATNRSRTGSSGARAFPSTSNASQMDTYTGPSQASGSGARASTMHPPQMGPIRGRSCSAPQPVPSRRPSSNVPQNSAHPRSRTTSEAQRGPSAVPQNTASRLRTTSEIQRGPGGGRPASAVHANPSHDSHHRPTTSQAVTSRPRPSDASPAISQRVSNATKPQRREILDGYPDDKPQAGPSSHLSPVPPKTSQATSRARNKTLQGGSSRIPYTDRPPQTVPFPSHILEPLDTDVPRTQGVAQFEPEVSEEVRIPKSFREFYEELFLWKPRSLMTGGHHSKSTTTREPKYYDMHLQRNLRLKKVVVVKDMVGVLAGICGREASRSVHPLSNLEERPETMRRWSASFEANTQLVKNENELVGFIKKYRTPMFCEVASAIRFHRFFDPVLNWVTKQPTPQSRAIADGFLRLRGGSDTERLLPENDRSTLRLIHEHGFETLAVWEYKSLRAGPLIMDQISTISGDFPWITCHERSHESDVSSYCQHRGHRIHGRLAVSGKKTGPDSPFFRYPELEEMLRAASARPMEGAQGLATRRYPSNKDGVWIVQQGWAEAVVNDTTFIIFSSGNDEFIGIRHRESQTLFLSSRIHVDRLGRGDDSPSYGEVMVGLFLAAIEDSADRARLFHRLLLDSDAVLPLYNIVTDPDPTNENKPVQNAARRDRRHQVDTEIFEGLQRSEVLSLRLHEQTLDFPAHVENSDTLLFVRLGFQMDAASKQIKILEPNSNTTPTGSTFFLDLEGQDSSYTSPRTQKVYLGKSGLAGCNPVYYSKPLALKIADTVNDISGLRNEYQTYCQRLSENTQPKADVEIYGLFACRFGGTPPNGDDVGEIF